MEDLSIAWPPLYKLRKHRLARGVKMRATKANGLEITVPYRFSLKHIPAILDENKAWIVKQLLIVKAQVEAALPISIALHALNETWPVVYIPIDARLQLIQRPQQELVLTGKTHDKAACINVLQRWLKKRAHAYLTERLDAVSQQTGLAYDTLSVRNQKTMWGSCTIDRSISLNYKLIFLPQAYVDYVIIHELCHTMHLNHSVRFWALVERFDSDWRSHRRALRQADHYMPAWL